MNWLDTIKTHCFSYAHANGLPRQRLRVNHFLYFFHIFKELLIGKSQYRSRDGLNMGSCFIFSPIENWWRLTGSNRRPPACKAGALPAELNPPFSLALVGLVGLEPTTPALSTQCSNQLSYRPITSGLRAEKLRTERSAWPRHRFNSALSPRSSVLLLNNR